MGGEITYEHISAKKYKVKVTLYRDCNDCKFAGQGGGASTNNCSDLTQVFLRTLTNTCGNKNIGSINLAKTGFENITEVCDLDNSRCGSNPTVSYGIEAHYYSGFVDFADYLSYSGCGIQLFIHKSERSDDIVSIATEQQKIYTYAYINPWIESVSSPVFEHSPKIVFQSNQAAYATTHAIEQSGDSLHYSWGIPETDYNTPVNYTSGYSANNWITGYCASGTSSCPANPHSTPPSGLFLNAATGDYTVTPTSSSEKSIRVIEVEQWRKNNGTYYLAGKIRREAIALVMSSPANNPPIITPNRSYTLCVGQPFSDTISVTDAPINSSTSADSVSIKFTHSIAGLVAKEISTSVAPYAYAQIDFTPTSSQVGTHYIGISARDNQCPKYASSTATIKIVVVAKPTLSISIDEKFCGTNELKIESNRDVTANLFVTNSDNQTTELFDITSPYVHQEVLKGSTLYQLIYTDDFGCTDSVSSTIANQGNNNVAKADLLGNLSPCSDANAAYNLLSSEGVLGNTTWNYNNTETESDTLAITVTQPKLVWAYTLTKESIVCPMQDSTTLNVVQSPRVDVASPPVKCFSNTLDLNAINASPSGGTWSYQDQEINPSFDISTITVNRDTTLPLRYTYQDINSGCSSSKTIDYVLKQSPELVLRNQSICGTDNLYFLTNAIELPYASIDRDITWEVIDFPSALILTPRESLDVPTLGIGVYHVKGTNSLPNGCIATDTAVITVTDKLTITINDTREVCENKNEIKLSDLLDVSVEGGFWESDIIDLTNGITVNTSKHCGMADLKYIYDQNYCYAELEVSLDFICQPNFSFALPDSICSDASPIELSSALQWTSDGNSTITSLNPSSFDLGVNSLVASINSSTCFFDTTSTFEILSPLDLSINTLQAKLCQGDTLQFDIQKPSYSSVSIASCNSVFEGGLQNSYTPGACDLAAQKILLTATTNSTAQCPSHSKNVELPYFAKPIISLPKNISECEPFVVGEANLPKDVDFIISNSSMTHIGDAQRLQNIVLSEGKYQLNAFRKDDNGCINQQDIKNFIRINPKPYASFAMGNNDRLTLSKREVSLYNYSSITNGSFNSNWYYKKLNNTINFSTSNNPTYQLPADTGNFRIMLVAESTYECKDTSYQNVLVVPDIIAFIPSAFTPDNKGPKSNSVFRVTSDHAQEYKIDIFNKWGQKVYASTDIEEVWDGTYLGQYCQNGVYVYAIVLINKAGKEYTYQGTVNLIR